MSKPFDIKAEEKNLFCLRCGTDKKKRLVALVQPFKYATMDGPSTFRGSKTEFYVCHNRRACRDRRQQESPAKMTTQTKETNV